MTKTSTPRLRSLSSWPAEFKDAVFLSAIAIGVSAAAVISMSDDPQSRIYTVGSLPMQSKITLDVTQSPKEKLRKSLVSEDRDGIAFTSVGEEISYSRPPQTLDVVLVDAKGSVTKVHQIEPGKAATLPAPAASSLVIELPKGKAKFYGLKPGAKLAQSSPA
jgi:hypothetical protein